jgi:hypothetical protein
MTTITTALTYIELCLRGIRSDCFRENLLGGCVDMRLGLVGCEVDRTVAYWSHLIPHTATSVMWVTAAVGVPFAGWPDALASCS